MSSSTGFRWSRVSAWLVVVLLVIFGGRYMYWNVAEHRFATISEGRLYQSAVMPAGDLVEVVRRHQIKSVVDLRDVRNEVLSRSSEGVVLSEMGVRYFNIESKQVPADETVDQFLKVAEDPANLPMLVHCHHGVGRSVLFAALYRIEFEGWDPEVARKATKALSFRGAFAPDGEKGRYLRSYKSRRNKGSAPPTSADPDKPRP